MREEQVSVTQMIQVPLMPRMVKLSLGMSKLGSTVKHSQDVNSEYITSTWNIALD